jgi:hypothetical protein
MTNDEPVRRDVLQTIAVLHNARLNSFGTFHCFSSRPHRAGQHRSYELQGVRK